MPHRTHRHELQLTELSATTPQAPTPRAHRPAQDSRPTAARDERHRVRQAMHEVERGAEPSLLDELDAG